jgi:ribosomal protein S12 methylthiotransferase
MKNTNVSIVTLGCSKNEIDSDLMASILRKYNYQITEDLSEAEIIIVNTCGFIDAAKEESIDTMWEITKYKSQGSCKILILAGCLAERYPRELLEEVEQIDGIIGTGNINNIFEFIEEIKSGKRLISTGNIDSEYIENVNRSINGKTAYIKISEGCNNFCTYCIIPKLRGRYRSRKIENIVNEAKYLVQNGVKELILIAQNTTDYGIDLYGTYKLPDLLDELNKIKGLKWIRLLYMYPDNFNKDLIRAIKENDKVVKYLDIPIQHINNDILKKMNRNTNKGMITSLIHNLREEIPEIVLRTTIIVGFPGETNEQFNELYDYVNHIKFDRLGVFTYSKEEGTKASEFENQISEKVKASRQDKIMMLQKQISFDINKSKVGRIYEVLVEEYYEDDIYIGRTYMDSPEIDGIIYVKSKNKLDLGSFVNVRVSEFLEYDLVGEIVNESSK